MGHSRTGDQTNTTKTQESVGQEDEEQKQESTRTTVFYRGLGVADLNPNTVGPAPDA